MKNLKPLFFLLLTPLTGCLYQPLAVENARPFTLAQVQRDLQGLLHNALVEKLESAGFGYYSPENAQIEIAVAIEKDEKKSIGHRYDQNNSTGDLQKNIVACEDRRSLHFSWRAYQLPQRDLLVEKKNLFVYRDYDYISPNTSSALLYTASNGSAMPMLTFSLGQLDDQEGAHNDVLEALYHALAEKIAEDLLYHYPNNG